MEGCKSLETHRLKCVAAEQYSVVIAEYRLFDTQSREVQDSDIPDFVVSHSQVYNRG
jgi:hypothetical protein